jgi:hypothetical protein
MKLVSIARHYIWIAPLVLGFVFIGAGIFMVTEGRSAKDEVRDAIVSENIITSEDASIPNVLVDNAAKAKAEADVIEVHYLELTGGKTYAELDRDDPNRETAFRAVQLRTSLNLAVMGFRISDLVIGMGAFMIVIGGAFVVFIAPAVFYSAQVANHYEELVKKERAQEKGATP